MDGMDCKLCDGSISRFFDANRTEGGPSESFAAGLGIACGDPTLDVFPMDQNAASVQADTHTHIDEKAKEQNQNQPEGEASSTG